MDYKYGRTPNFGLKHWDHIDGMFYEHFMENSHLDIFESINGICPLSVTFSHRSLRTSACASYCYNYREVEILKFYIILPLY